MSCETRFEAAAGSDRGHAMRFLCVMIALALLSLSGSASAQTSKDLFAELKAAGGIHPLANLVCYPTPGQDGQEGVFELVGFSASFADSVRRQGKPVPKEFLGAEKDAEKDRFILV